MYWAYTTMTTVGYGDISSVTIAEKVWRTQLHIRGRLQGCRERNKDSNSKNDRTRTVPP